LLGRTSLTAPYNSYAIGSPAILYGGRVEKSIFTKDVNGKIGVESECIMSIAYTCQICTLYPINQLGIVSPKFHVKFDDFYESTKCVKFMPRSEWQYKARIIREKPATLRIWTKTPLQECYGTTRSITTQVQPLIRGELIL